MRHPDAVFATQALPSFSSAPDVILVHRLLKDAPSPRTRLS